MKSRKFLAKAVRCVTNQRTGARGWIFYGPDNRAYLSASKLSQMVDDRAVMALMDMKSHENRRLDPLVELYVMQGRSQLLVHRIVDARGLVPSAQNRLFD